MTLVPNEDQDDPSVGNTKTPSTVGEFSDTDNNRSDKMHLSFQQAMEKSCDCKKMEGNPSVNPSYIYAIGRIQARFPDPSIEKEFRQATGRTETAGQTDPEALRSVLSARSNRYLAREMCWILTIEGMETYILRPHDAVDLDLFVESLRNSPRPTDMDVIVGIRGPIAPPEICNGLTVPIVIIDQVYSFDRDVLVKSIPRPEKTPAKQFTATAEELLDRIMQMADNVGATDEHRALNYLAVRYNAIYANAVEMHGRDFSLTAIEVRPSRLSGTYKILDVIFSYTNRNTTVVEKYFTRVAVAKYPHLVSPLSPYYDR
jgi:PatG Domain